jgi:hypothetical protein
MDGRGAWRDNLFVERLWKSVKDEEVYLHAYDSAVPPKLASEITLPSTTSGARTRRLTAIHPTTFTSNLSPSRWLPNRWSCTYPGREDCLGRRDHLSRTGLITAATIRNM